MAGCAGKTDVGIFTRPPVSGAKSDQDNRPFQTLETPDSVDDNGVIRHLIRIGDIDICSANKYPAFLCKLGIWQQQRRSAG